MEEIKDKKILNKKSLLICYAITLVFALIGFIDIKSNAAESDNSIEFIMPIYTEDMNCANVHKEVIYGQEDMEVYYIQSHNEPSSDYLTYALAYVVSDYPMTNAEFDSYDGGETFYEDTYGPYSSVEFSVNGKIKYICQVANRNEWSGVSFVDFDFKWDNCKKITRWYDMAEFQQAYINNSLEIEIDYNSFEVDDDLPVPSNIKRNIIKNEIKDNLIPNTLGGETYDYITWTNTSETHPLQLQVVPVVQYFDVRPFENIFTKEFYGEWNTQAIYEDVTNSFTLCTFATNSDTLLKYPLFSSGLSFKSECNDKYSKGIFEENYLKFGYRIRYVDIENEKAGPWLVLVPTKELDDYKTFVEYADTSISDSSDGNGLFNEYENLDDIENAKTDIKTENDFKDKYDVIDGDVDVQEATNWLYSVVNFIKGTPQVVGSVLGFLPQPILYGMYVCIFLGIIASGLAIVKALF